MLNNGFTQLLRKLEKCKKPVQRDSEDKTQIEAIKSTEINLLTDKKMVKIHREVINCIFISKSHLHYQQFSTSNKVVKLLRGNESYKS